MFYEFISRFHLWSAIFALVFGLAVFFVRKGTRLHKQLGYAYFFNMLGLNISALFIYQLTGNFGPFHIFGAGKFAHPHCWIHSCLSSPAAQRMARLALRIHELVVRGVGCCGRF